LLFSASLGYPGVLGDKPFHGCFGALTLCVPRPQKSQKPESPPRIERIDSLEGEKAWAGTGERIGARITLIET
jgi:hypothetical protein